MNISNKVDRRILKTKEAINKAFLELLADKDFEKITVNDISDGANLNRGTFYLHYTDKYDLLDRCIEDHHDNMVKVCSAQDSIAKDFDFVHSLLPVFQYFENNSMFFSSMLSNRSMPSFRDRMQKMILQGIREHMNMNDINQGMNQEVVAQFMASAFVGVIEWWLAAGRPHPPLFMAEQLWKLLERNQIYRMPSTDES